MKCSRHDITEKLFTWC